LRVDLALRSANLVRDVLVGVGNAPQVVEDVERVGEARRRQEQRERVRLLLPVEVGEPIPEAVQSNRVLTPEELQSLRLQPEELVELAKTLAP
jgi:hypothetical protein